MGRSDDDVERVLDNIEFDYIVQGWAVADVSQMGPQWHGCMQLLEERLNLGAPVIPLLYRAGSSAPQANYSFIRATPDPDHPSFTTTVAQPFHTDGLLEPLGSVRTSVLLCLTSASSGGATAVFRSDVAVAELAKADPEAFTALRDPEALIRRNTIGAACPDLIGPIVALQGGRLCVAYSTAQTDHWQFSGLDDGCPLWRARQYLDACAASGRLTSRVLLQPGQALFIANDRVSHGREAFRCEIGSEPRSLVRGLYGSTPRRDL